MLYVHSSCYMTHSMWSLHDTCHVMTTLSDSNRLYSGFRKRLGLKTQNGALPTHQFIKFIGCGGVCMLILQVVTRLADLGDMSAQLEDKISASSHHPFSRKLVRSICATTTKPRNSQGPETSHQRPSPLAEARSGITLESGVWNQYSSLILDNPPLVPNHAAHSGQTQYSTRV
jgi:hypothetical protein